MITIHKGNLLDCKAEALVNAVNCVGVMGKGIALQFKQAYPNNFREYEKACKRNELKLGEMFVVPTGSNLYPRYIINFPTKNHWREKSNIADVETGLVDLIRVSREYNLKSVAIPPLGCGLGGLNWRDVKPLLDQYLQELADVEFYVFEPDTARLLILVDFAYRSHASVQFMIFFIAPYLVHPDLSGQLID